ncbi:SDR family NAD(P)-dependent oxidoreductase [bacterium]|nr:SDR family NAD(P)-dependent oxidoreductase [bacterium]
MKPYIIILGAGPGISNAVAMRFASEGFEVYLVARNEHKLQLLTEKLAQQGVAAHYTVANLADPLSLKNAIDRIKAHKGNPAMVLYNAAAVDVKHIFDQDWAIMQRTLETNLGAPFHLIKILLPDMLTANEGKLFFTGGGFALNGDPLWTTLSVGKAAQRNLIQAAAKLTNNTNVHLAQLIVCGYVNESDEKYNPNAIAEQYWKLFVQQPGAYETEVIY